VPLPDGFNVRFLRTPTGMPGPDFEPFNVPMFDCRTYFIKKKKEPFYESVEICLGFEITTARGSGPIAR
jgi:hypothetical protein